MLSPTEVAQALVATALTLRDVVERVEELDDELTIYAVPDWTPESVVLV